MIWCSRMMLRAPYFGLCLSEKAFHTELKRLRLPRDKWPAFLTTPQADATTHFLVNPLGRRVALVCLGNTEGRTPIEVAGLLIHEAVHIFDDEMVSIGEHSAGNEVRAYGIQHIAQELLQAYAESGE